MKSREVILQVKNLTVGYPGKVVLRNVNFSVEKGEIMGVVGQNGSGKSTLLKGMYGLLPKRSGQVYVNGHLLNDKPPHELVGQGISYYAQGGLIMPALTVKEHLELAVILSNRDSFNDSLFEEVLEIFPSFKNKIKKIAGSLSGGERQMLSMAIMLIQNNRLWLLDEPTAGLSPQMVDFTVSFLKRMNEEKNIAMLIVEHNMSVIRTLASKLVVVQYGTLTSA